MATEATRAIEAILMVAQEPVDPHLLAQLLEVSPARVEELCHELQAAYTADDRGFVLVKVAGGYRFQSHGDLAPYVERFVLEGQTARLSAAALETLAIVAYKQPISRAQVAAIRGVNVDVVMRTLHHRGYIADVGRDPGPGQATMSGTTSEILERLGLASLGDLPPIADLLPDASVLEALERGLRPEPAVAPAPDDTGESGSRAESSEDPLADLNDSNPTSSLEHSYGQLPDTSDVIESPGPGERGGADDLELPSWFDATEPASPPQEVPGTGPIHDVSPGPAGETGPEAPDGSA